MKNRSATTLIEILVYFTIFGVFLTAAFSFAIQIVNLSELTSRLYELEAQSSFVEENMKTALLTAEEVDGANSVFDADAGILTLTMSEVESNPTVFSVSNGQIFMQEGAGAAEALHSSLLQVTSLRFHRITYDKTPDQIQVDAIFTVPSDLANIDADLSLHFTISLRP
jgi:hypothetical protein